LRSDYNFLITSIQEILIKIDIKLATIIVLVGVVGVLLGIVLGRGPSSAPTQTTQNSQNFIPADDGKLAKEYKEQVIVGVIRENAKDLQKCYLSYLDKKPKINEGVLNLLLKVEEDGSISSVSITKNEFEDKEMAECVSNKIAHYYLAPPPYGINRNISHVLAFKTEATAEREAKERQLKNQPPKVLPVTQ
jgi:hypothetical protein